MIRADHGLTFDWRDGRHISLMLPFCIVLSLLAHGMAGYLFQVTYPPAAPPQRPPAEVAFLSPAPGNEAVWQWIAAETPTAVLVRNVEPPAHLMELSYVPSFEQSAPVLKEAPNKPFALKFPSIHDSEAWRGTRTRPQPLPSIPGQDSTVQFSSAIRERLKTRPTSPAVSNPSTNPSLAPTSFLVGITRSGEPRYAFLQARCGDDRLDQQAEAFLSELTFTEGTEPITWGEVTILWGNDAFRPPQNSKLP